MSLDKTLKPSIQKNPTKTKKKCLNQIKIKLFKAKKRNNRRSAK